MSVPLSEYVTRIPKTRTASPPGSNKRWLVLTDEVQQLLRLLLKLMQDLTTNNQSLSILKARNIFVEEVSRIPRLHGESRTSYNANLAENNYKSLGMIFRVIIFKGVSSLPPDFQELLCLMGTKGHSAPYLIQRHCSLVRPLDKKELFLRLYYPWNNLVQHRRNSNIYRHVMKNLVFPSDWVRRIKQNQYLNMYYNGGGYYLVGIHAGSDVLRFTRNTYSHPWEHARDSTMQLRYNQAQLAEMMEAALPLVLHSFQVALNHLKLLEDIDVEAFFR